MPTDVGIKDPTWVAKDGGTTAGASATFATGVVLGQDIDVRGLDADQTLLPDAVAIKLGLYIVTAASTAASDTGTPTPQFEAYALWQEGTGDTATAKDREGQIAIVANETTKIAIKTTGPYTFAPTNVRVIPVKGRYLKILYKLNPVGSGIAGLKAGVKVAPIFGIIE